MKLYTILNTRAILSNFFIAGQVIGHFRSITAAKRAYKSFMVDYVAKNEASCICPFMIIVQLKVIDEVGMFACKDNIVWFEHECDRVKYGIRPK